MYLLKRIVIIFTICVISSLSYSHDQMMNIFGDKLCIQGELPTMKLLFLNGSSSVPISRPVDVKPGVTWTNMTIADKSPVSLIYELATYNKINVKYELILESGPSHQKKFVVALRLGNRKNFELFKGQGASLNEAKRAASSQALIKTSFAKPFLKPKGLECTKGDISTHGICINKSPISLLHELSQEHNFKIEYDTTTEGPAHKPKFTIECKVGQQTTVGEGQTKKQAKNRAAQKMLEIIDGQFLDSISAPKIKNRKQKNKSKNKLTDSSMDKNPIMQLLKLSTDENMKVEGSPRYSDAVAIKHGFETTCHLGERSTVGRGRTKKASKRDAAQKMVEELLSQKPYLNKIMENIPNVALIRDKLGIFEMPDYIVSLRDQKETISNEDYSIERESHIPKDSKIENGPRRHKEVQLPHKSMSQNQIKKESFQHAGKEGKTHKTESSEDVDFKSKLDKLGESYNFKVDYVDFVKSHGGDYLSIVSLSTNPPWLCYGTGFDKLQSHQNAAKAATAIISDLILEQIHLESANIQQTNVREFSDSITGGKLTYTADILEK